MTDATIRRLEEATEGSRELDYLFHQAVGWVDLDQGGWIRGEDRTPEAEGWPRYTTNLQHAVDAVPADHEWSAGVMDGKGEGCVWRCTPYVNEHGEKGTIFWTCRGKPVALSLCIAILKAMKAMNDDP